MDGYALLRKLQARHQAWVKERFSSLAPGRPDYLNGALKGFQECIDITREFLVIQKNRNQNWRHRRSSNGKV